MLNGGLVDYILGAEPGPGVFVIGHNDDPTRAQYMNYFKMGEGPFYTFYVPYHLPHLEAPITVARAALFHDATIAPLGRPICDVIAVAKRDLAKGHKLDGIGGFDTYGVIENTKLARSENTLPMGLSEDCILLKDISKDQTILLEDIKLPAGRLVDKLWEEQRLYFF
jgi:predicted homoserine dehydrogenase-like protein